MNYTLPAIIVLLSVGTIVLAAQDTHREQSLFTVSGFIEYLIEKGIVPSSEAERARELGDVVERVEGADSTDGAVEIRASQLIEYGDLTYSAGGNIQGLLLLARNTTDQELFLEAKRGCQVTYQIYDERDTLLYDSASRAQCETNERVEFRLAAGETRMFRVNHAQTVYPLSPGTYRFVLIYPEYGSDERTITVE